MLAKKFRLPVQFFVGKKAEIKKSPYFWVKKFAISGQDSRFGVTVGTGVAKKATERNRLRRMVYNYIREHYKQIPAGDYWITVLPLTTGLEKKLFESELNKILI